MRPHWIGPVVLCGIIDILLLSLLYTQQLTLDSLNSAFDFMTEDIAKKAWLDSKSQYIKGIGAFSRADMVTYRRMWIKRYQAKSHLAFMLGLKPAFPSPTINENTRALVTCDGNLKEFKEEANEAVCEAIGEFPGLDAEDVGDVAALVHELEKNMHAAYKHEMELIIRFLMSATQNARLMSNKSKKAFLKFITTKIDLLNCLDINIMIPTSGSID